MPDMDDIDARFQALTAQIDERERRRMSRAAARWQPRSPHGGRRRRRWVPAVAAVALMAGAGVLVAYRPDVADRIRAVVSERLADPGTAPVFEATAPADGEGNREEGEAETEPVKASPFDGSPAAQYADGVKGLVTPPARAMGGLSRKEVAAALRQAKDLLAVAHLDRKVLMGGRPMKLIGLLDPEQRTWSVKNLDRRGAREGGSRNRVTSLKPGSAELISTTFKVDGETRLSTFREDGVRGVRVKVNYLFVYAIQRPGRPETRTRLVAHSVGAVDAWRDRGRLRFWITRWNDGGVAPARCGTKDGFVHPFYPDSKISENDPKATGPAVDPYSRKENEERGECSRLKSDT
ncbi:hypothetical protein GCM10010517_09590 [Streptosporangium fragile]|uniref:Uncharacterized protein n=1 Tax=Streptosporangium fragile TaxID=46186 RepID=A0ABP6I7E7_9ACTN